MICGYLVAFDLFGHGVEVPFFALKYFTQFYLPSEQILVANKYKSDAARFAAEGAKAEAKRMAHELALSHIEGLQQIKQRAVHDAALQKDFLVSEKEKAQTANAVLLAEQEHTKASRHEYAVARAESLHAVRQNAVTMAAKEREALASAQQQAIQVLPATSAVVNMCAGGGCTSTHV